MKIIIITLTIILSTGKLFSQIKSNSEIDKMNREEFLEYVKDRINDKFQNVRYENKYSKEYGLTDWLANKAKKFDIRAEEIYTGELKERLKIMIADRWSREEIDSLKILYSMGNENFFNDQTKRIKRKDTIRTYQEIYDSIRLEWIETVDEERLLKNRAYKSADIFKIAEYYKDTSLIPYLKERYNKVKKGYRRADKIYLLLVDFRQEPYYSEFVNMYKNIKLGEDNERKALKLSQGLEEDFLNINQYLGQEGIYLYSRTLLFKDFRHPPFEIELSVDSVTVNEKEEEMIDLHKGMTEEEIKYQNDLEKSIKEGNIKGPEYESLYDIYYRVGTSLNNLSIIINKEYLDLVKKYDHLGEMTDKDALKFVNWMKSNIGKYKMRKGYDDAKGRFDYHYHRYILLCF